jgi:hypothetical protein
MHRIERTLERAGKGYGPPATRRSAGRQVMDSPITQALVTRANRANSHHLHLPRPGMGLDHLS